MPDAPRRATAHSEIRGIGFGGGVGEVLEWPYTARGGGVLPPWTPRPPDQNDLRGKKTTFTIGKIWCSHFWYTHLGVPDPLPILPFVGGGGAQGFVCVWAGGGGGFPSPPPPLSPRSVYFGPQFGRHVLDPPPPSASAHRRRKGTGSAAWG